MADRGSRRGVGAPFYAPLRRKTSAEIISEARAAIYGEMSGSSSAAGGAAGALRPLRTRRPFTPREPQRSLFTDRSRKTDTRPPSAFDLKHLSLSETSEDALVTMGARVVGIDEDTINGVLLSDSSTHQITARKKPAVSGANRSLRNQPRSMQERSGDGWSVFPKLPHLSGRAKPLHRRNTTHSTPEEPTEYDLAQTISVTRPSGMDGDVVPTVASSTKQQFSKSLSPDYGSKRQVFAATKSQSYDTSMSRCGADIGVKHISVQRPHSNTSLVNSDSMSILEVCDALSQRMEAERTTLMLRVLQARLEASTPASSLRELVLRSLYTHIDSEDAAVLVAIARAMLTMRVTGKHLAAACKIIFKIAKNDKNDHFFKETNLLELLVEGCGRAEPVSESECCVYGGGALRVLALEPALRRRALAAGAVHLAAIHLKIINTAKADNPRSMSDQTTHALYQLTGALRNLATDSDGREFIASGALGELVTALALHTDRDVLTNVARCLSVLSAVEPCCACLCAEGGSARHLLRALAACAARPALAVRLAYTLGNMAAADHRASHYIYNEEGGIDVLLTILESYTKRSDNDVKDPDLDPDLHLIGTDLGGSDGSNEDVLIKTVRVVANLCLTEEAGRALAAAHAERVVAALLACLDLAENTTLHHHMECVAAEASVVERGEELAAAALATLNNITFYREPQPLDNTLDNICRVTCRWLVRGGAASCEAARALGNITRAPRAAQLFLLDGTLDALAPFLRHHESTVRCSAAGVLVNLCGASGGSSAATLAVEALATAHVIKDHQQAALLARALWNAVAVTPLPDTHAHHAAVALAAFIDDETVFAPCEASKSSDRRASDPSLFKQHVTFEMDNNNDHKAHISRAISVVDLHLESSEDGVCSGEDLGFEDGGEECECEPCRRLAAWEELAGVAIPLLEKLRPNRADASVGTD